VRNRGKNESSVDRCACIGHLPATARVEDQCSVESKEKRWKQVTDFPEAQGVISAAMMEKAQVQCAHRQKRGSSVSPPLLLFRPVVRCSGDGRTSSFNAAVVVDVQTLLYARHAASPVQSQDAAVQFGQAGWAFKSVSSE
jgi:hypothetical protein